MTIQQIRSQVAHRPWSLPTRPWQFYQEWNDCLFLHWRVDAAALRAFVPADLEIDQIQGSAWVSVVAFSMERIRPRYLPAFPPVSNFGEVNIRTYVKASNKAGVYFLSIEGSKKLSCTIAREASELPYRYSRMRRTAQHFSVANTEFGDTFELEYEVGKEVSEKSAVDRWLTERYALFQDAGDHINAFDIHHLEWGIHQLAIRRLELNYSRFADLLTLSPDLTHYSKGVQVLAWGKVSKRIV